MTVALRETLAEHAVEAARPDPWPTLTRYAETGAIASYVSLVDELAGRRIST